MKNKKGRVIIDCWDDGGRTLDRYSIAISGLQSALDRTTGKQVAYTYWLGASANPFHPQGFGQHGPELPTAEYFPSRYTHLGHPVNFLDLPPDVQRFVRGELQADPDNNKIRDILQHVRDAVTATPESDSIDAEISGTEFYDWFTAWRGNAVDLLAELDKGVE